MKHLSLITKNGKKCVLQRKKFCRIDSKIASFSQMMTKSPVHSDMVIIFLSDKYTFSDLWKWVNTYGIQGFSTCVPRFTSVPSNFSRRAAKLYNVWYIMQKISFFFAILVLLLHFGVPPNSFKKLMYYKLKKVQNYWPMPYVCWMFHTCLCTKIISN